MVFGMFAQHRQREGSFMTVAMVAWLLTASFALQTTVAPLPVMLEQGEQSTGHHLAVGTRWTYRNYNVARRSTNRIIEETVTSISGHYVTSERVDIIYPQLTRSTPETRRFSLNDRIFSPDITSGDHWVEPAVEKGGSSITYTVIGPAEITTPAGRFSTMKVRAEFMAGSQRYQQLLWYAASVFHMVRIEYINKGKPYEATELTAFSTP